MSSTTSSVRLLAVGLAAALSACGGDSLVLPNEGQASTIVIMGGDAQSGPSGATLAQDLAVRVTDALNRPVENQPVVFTFPTGSSIGDVAPDTAITDGGGQAATKWTLGPAAGGQQVRAAVIVDGAVSTFAVTFNATAVASAATSLELASGNNQTGPVNSALADSLAVKVVDAFGNPVAGIQVTWTVSNGGSVQPATVLSGADGRAATRRVLGPVAGTQRAQAAVAGLKGSPVAFQHTAVAAAPTRLVYVSGNGQQAPAGLQLPDSLVVRLMDADDNGIGGRIVTWVVGPSSGGVDPVNSTTDADGYAVTRWTLSATAGGDLLNAVFSGLPSVPFTATATADVPTQMVLNAGNNQSGVVGTTLPTQLAVKVTDANNNPVENVAVTWTAKNGGSVSATSTGTDANGIAHVSRTLGLLPGSYATTAEVDGLTGSPVTFTSTATVGLAARLAIVTPPSGTASSGAVLAPQPVVQVQDLLGNAVAQSGWSITATASAGGALGGTVTRTTDAAGRAAFTNLSLSGAAADTYTLTFTSGLLLPVTSGGITLGAGTATKLVLLTPPSSNVGSGQVFPQQPVIEVQDAAGNPIASSGRTVTVVIASGGGTLDGTKEKTTDDNGHAAFTDLAITGSTGGRTLRFASASLTDVVSGTITVGAGAATQIAVRAGNGQTAVANSVLLVDPAVIVKDANGNPVEGAAVTFAVTSGGGSITGENATTDAAGVAAVGSWRLGTTAGPNTLRATSSGLTGSPVTFSATGTVGAPTQITAASATTQAAPASTDVGAPPSVLVRDASNNPVAGVAVTFTLTAGGGSIDPASPASVTTDADGIATLTSWTLGPGTEVNNNTVTAAATGLTGSPVTFRASGVAGLATQIAVNGGNNQTATVGAVVAVDPSVIVKDALGNPVAGVAVTFSVTAGNGSLTAANAVTNAAGIATVGSWQLRSTPGTNTLTATMDDAPGSSVTFTATGTVQTTATVGSSDLTSAFGQLVTFTATLTSSAGTPTGSVRFVIDGDDSATVALSGGQAVYATSGLAAGTHTVRAAYAGNGGFLASMSSPITQTVNGAPQANADDYSVNEDAASLNVNPANGVLNNDTDPESSSLTAVLESGPSHAAAFNLNANGSFTYTPAANFNGTDAFTYRASDGQTQSGVATVTITVNAVNDAPSFAPGPDQSVTVADGQQSIAGWASAISAGPSDESGQVLAFEVSNNNSALFASDGAPAIASDGTLTYSPAGIEGTATVTVRLTDNGGTASGGADTSGDQTFTITVGPAGP